MDGIIAPAQTSELAPAQASAPNIKKAGPITEAIGGQITSDHITKGLELADRVITAKTTGGHALTKLGIWLNYGVIVLVVSVLAWLNLKGTMPAEALTGFLGTGIGYWLATGFHGTDE